MQIPTFPDQIPTKLPLLCEIWGFGTNGEFLSSFGLFSLVRATPNLATTIRVGLLYKYFLRSCGYSLSCNAMPLRKQRHCANHGALLLKA